MNSPRDEGGYWLGWCFAYAMLAVLFCFALWQWQQGNICEVSEPAWLPWSEPEEHCFREWVAALSGWVGFAAAAAGAYFVYHQLSEQRKQTAFLLGDADPEFVLMRNRAAKRITLRVTNWNRRNLMVEKVECISPVHARVVNLIDSKDRPSWEKQTEIRTIPAFRFNGWIDRTRAPERRSLVVVFADQAAHVRDPATSLSQVGLKVTYRIMGERHKTSEAEVFASDLVED